MADDLALSGLRKTYGGVTAVEHITMRIGQGELVAFLGPSGCGKTTTLRMIAGLTDPSEGQVLIGRDDVTHLPPHKRNIGMLFQSYALFPHMTIAENVAFGLKMRRVAKAERGERVKTALELVRLGAMTNRMPSALSGGQQQRVALARAIVIQPALLLLDEPLGALDKTLREAMQVEIRQIQKRLNMTTVLVTHDQEEALTMADKIVIMNNGLVEQIGTPTEIYSRPVNRFVAGFIGASNFLSGDVVGTDGAASRINLAGGGQITVCTPLLRQTALSFTVRPEAIEVLPGSDTPPTGNWTRAIIEDVIYRGQSTHVLMRRSGGESFAAHLPNRTGTESHAAFSPGADVVAYWRNEGNHHLTGE